MISQKNKPLKQTCIQKKRKQPIRTYRSASKKHTQENKRNPEQSTTISGKFICNATPDVSHLHPAL
ncbi:MAG: hypothetical protein WCP97_08295 [bacterium]